MSLLSAAMPNHRIINGPVAQHAAELYRSGLGAPAIAKRLGCTINGVYGAMQRNGVLVRNRFIQNDVRAEIIRRHIDGESVSKLAQFSGFTGQGIREVLKQARCYRKGSSRRVSLNESAFDEWTPDASYWAGFLFADGCVRSHAGAGLRLSMTLNEIDVGHMKSFLDFVGSGHGIHFVARPTKRKPDNRVVMFGFHSNTLGRRLQAVGIVVKRGACKSRTLIASRDFWRGCIDGDGCLSWKKRKTAPAFPVLTLLGCKALMEQFLRLVQAICNGYRGRVLHRPRSRVYSVTLSGRHASALANWIYRPCDTVLERKKSRYIQFVEWVPSK